MRIRGREAHGRPHGGVGLVAPALPLEFERQQQQRRRIGRISCEARAQRRLRVDRRIGRTAQPAAMLRSDSASIPTTTTRQPNISTIGIANASTAMRGKAVIRKGTRRAGLVLRLM